MLTNFSENLILAELSLTLLSQAFNLILMDGHILRCFALTRNPAGTAYKH